MSAMRPSPIRPAALVLGVVAPTAMSSSAGSVPAEPGAQPPDAPVGINVGAIRGVDLCIFNKRSEPITVAFQETDGIQGSPDVAPGAWVCGYVRNSVLQNDVNGRVQVAGESLAFWSHNSLIEGPPSIALSPKRPVDKYSLCDLFKRLDEGEAFGADTAGVRYTAGRNGDDDNWKYMYINVEPSQGVVSPDECRPE